MNDCFCKRSGQIPHAASRVMSATMGSRRVVVVVRAARERRAVSWTGGAGWRAAPSTLLSLALASGRESFAARTAANLTVKPSGPHPLARRVGVPWPTPLHARRPAASVLIARAWR